MYTRGMVKTLKQWQEEVHALAKEKGWYDEEVPKRSDFEMLMLMVCELAEAAEEIRKGSEPFYRKFATYKPEGLQVELVDTVIRIMDFFEAKGWDLESVMQEKHAYNKTRPYRHGGKVL
jgi:hypothetical protein